MKLRACAVLFLILVIFFALVDPFHHPPWAGLWVYGLSALVTLTAAKGKPKPRPREVPLLERARRVWAAERECGMEPSEIFGLRPPPPEPPVVIHKVPRLDEVLAQPTSAGDLAQWQLTWDTRMAKQARKEPGRDWGAVVRREINRNAHKR